MIFSTQLITNCAYHTRGYTNIKGNTGLHTFSRFNSVWDSSVKAIIKTTTALNNIVESTHGPGLSYLYCFSAPYTTAISYTTQIMVH